MVLYSDTFQRDLTVSTFGFNLPECLLIAQKINDKKLKKYST